MTSVIVCVVRAFFFSVGASIAVSVVLFRGSFSCQAPFNTISRALRPFPERGYRLLSPPPPDICISSTVPVSQRPPSVTHTQSKLSLLCKAIRRKDNSRTLNAQVSGPRHSQSAPSSLDADTVQPASSTEIVEFNEDISVEAASESRTAEAIALKIRAVEYMAVNNKAELKVLIEELENLRPCAAPLRNSGIAFMFDDTTVWE